MAEPVTRRQECGNHSRMIRDTLARGGAARSEVAASWERCIRLHGLDPECRTTASAPDTAGTRSGRDGVDAEFELSPLAEQLGQLGLSLCTTDRAGFVLDRRSADRSVRADGQCAPGTSWAEEVQGTSAIGMTLRSSRPFAVCEAEHFMVANTGMSSVAVPLFGPSGALKGTLCAFGFRPDFASGLVPLLQSTLSTAAQRIEAHWFRLAYPKAMIVTMADCPRSGSSNALLAVDGELNVLGATHSVRCGGVTEAALVSGLHLDQFAPARHFGAASFVEAERAAIRRALSLSGQNVSAAAARLGISRATMHRKMAACRVSRRP